MSLLILFCNFIFVADLEFQPNIAGADPGFFLGGGALISCSTSTPINHVVFFFCRTPVVLENRRSSQGQGGGVHPLHPPPRSTPELCHLLQFHLSYVAVSCPCH